MSGLITCALGLTAPGAAGACQSSDDPGRTVVGLLVDVRAYSHDKEDFSEQDDDRLHRIGEMGPLLALIEDGTNRVRPYYGAPGDGPVSEIPETNADHIGHRIRATGCVSESDWPSVYDVTEVQLLDE